MGRLTDALRKLHESTGATDVERPPRDVLTTPAAESGSKVPQRRRIDPAASSPVPTMLRRIQRRRVDTAKDLLESARPHFHDVSPAVVGYVGQHSDASNEARSVPITRHVASTSNFRRFDPMHWSSDPNFRYEYESILSAIRHTLRLQESVVVAFFSTSNHAHTSELIVDLAETLQHQGENRVLLVDADMSARRLTQSWKIDERPGLTEALDQPSRWRRFLCQGRKPFLPVMPAGSGFVRAVDLTESMAMLVREWKDTFRWVLVDAGLTKAWPADALAVCSDAVLLHSDMRQGRADRFRYAVSHLRSVGSRIVGSVFSGTDWEQARHAS